MTALALKTACFQTGKRLKRGNERRQLLKYREDKTGHDQRKRQLRLTFSRRSHHLLFLELFHYLLYLAFKNLAFAGSAWLEVLGWSRYRAHGVGLLSGIGHEFFYSMTFVGKWKKYIQSSFTKNGKFTWIGIKMSHRTQGSKWGEWLQPEIKGHGSCSHSLTHLRQLAALSLILGPRDFFPLFLHIAILVISLSL